MPNASILNAGGTAQTTAGRGQQQVAVPVKPFVRSSMEHRESAGIDRTVQMTASDQDLGTFSIPAYGYLRSLFVVVTLTGGTGGAPVFLPDAPFSALKNVLVQEPNGSTIFQANTGYDLFAINKYGGYRPSPSGDLRSSPFYAATVPNASYVFRIPLELRGRDALGALPNQNAAASFVFRATVSGSGSVYSTAPTTLPTVRIRVFAEEWDQPTPSSDGSANSTTPPAMNTTQYWSPQVFPVVAGNNTIRLTRVGNYIRNLLFIYRDNAGARVTFASNNWPDIAQLYYDTRPVDTIQADQWRHTVLERYSYGGRGIAVNAAAGLDDGVFPYDFCHEFDGEVGYELNDGWLPTLSSTRLELQGTFGVAGTLTVLTNDVAVAGNVFLG